MTQKQRSNLILIGVEKIPASLDGLPILAQVILHMASKDFPEEGAAPINTAIIDHEGAELYAWQNGGWVSEGAKLNSAALAQNVFRDIVDGPVTMLCFDEVSLKEGEAPFVHLGFVPWLYFFKEKKRKTVSILSLEDFKKLVKNEGQALITIWGQGKTSSLSNNCLIKLYSERSENHCSKHPR